jgi:polysaccharide deacetylase 2 family uncharacterized protein YibQ
LLVVIALAVPALTVAYLFTSESGQALLLRAGLTDRFLEPLTVHLDLALAENFLNMGLLRGDLRARRVLQDETELREYTFRAPPHLTPTQCNLWLTRTVRTAGGNVVRAEENHKRGGEVVLWVGFGDDITHRLVVRAPEPGVPPREPPPAARVALVIDDLGHNMNSTTRGIFELGVPLTVAVLPNLANSGDAFREARERGVPVLLHLPMEPERNVNPGREPIRVGMSSTDIDAVIGRHLARYGEFIGVNNHMGSRATADAGTMDALAVVLARRDLFFLDSVTTPRSVGYRRSRQHGVWSLRNDLFLDDGTESAQEVASNLFQLCEIARNRGIAVGIAHPRPYTLQALRALLPRLLAEGIHFVTLEELRADAARMRASRS